MSVSGTWLKSKSCPKSAWPERCHQATTYLTNRTIAAAKNRRELHLRLLPVSTSDQTTKNQMQEIEAAGFDVQPSRVVCENISGSTAAEARSGLSSS